MESKERETYRIGKKYQQYAQPGHTVQGRNGQASRIAREEGVSLNTVCRALLFSIGVDAVRKQDAGVAESILNGKAKIPRCDLMRIGETEGRTQRELVREVLSGHRICSRAQMDKRKASHGRHPSLAEMKKKTNVSVIVNGIFSEGGTHQSTDDDFIQDLLINAVPFLNMIRRILFHDGNINSTNRETIAQAVHKNITQKIEEIEEEIRHYE